MDGPLVSVVTPTFNHARYIGRCIESLLAQSYPHWEHIIVDDGSTDDTEAVVRSYADPRIQYVKQANQGVAKLASTINKGVALSKGELITMFGSDDEWPADRLALQVPHFEDPRVVLVFGRGHIIDESGRVLAEAKLPRGLGPIVNRPEGTILRELLPSNFIPQYTVLLRRSTLDAIGGYLQPPGLLAEDLPTHLEFVLRGEFRFVDAPLGRYRMHAAQMTRNHRLRMWQTDLPYLLEYFRRLPPEMQARSGWTEDRLREVLDKKLVHASFDEGRRRLLAGDRTSARKHFAHGVRKGDGRTRIKSAVGYAFALVGKDLEGIARLTGHVPLR